MAFWSCVLKPGGKPQPYVPPPEGLVLHLSQAALPATVQEGQRVSVVLRQGSDDADGVVVCTLRAGATIPRLISCHMQVIHALLSGRLAQLVLLAVAQQETCLLTLPI
jgi:hypothetical protein